MAPDQEATLAWNPLDLETVVVLGDPVAPLPRRDRLAARLNTNPGPGKFSDTEFFVPRNL
jgi:hypothetical protein